MACAGLIRPWLFLFVLIPRQIPAQGPYYPNHWYGANQGNIRSGVVPDFGPEPVKTRGLTGLGVENPPPTLAPHICGFNTFTRKCMDPENFCPGRCMNFAYTYNVIYDCRCLVIKK